MGNCQAVDAAALVIQHPSGRLERLYWPVTASEVMRMNPGHYVSLIIPSTDEPGEENQEQKTVQFTRVKLLRPTDTLALGHAYRLVATQEVIKVLRAKKHAKSKRQQTEPEKRMRLVREMTRVEREAGRAGTDSKPENDIQVMNYERRQPRTAPKNTAASRSRPWRPSLGSITEFSS